MLLKSNINLVAFLKTVQQCKGKVIFYSNKGDKLNLKSILCRYIFFARYSENKNMLYGTIDCQDQEDYLLLKDYLDGSEPQKER